MSNIDYEDIQTDGETGEQKNKIYKNFLTVSGRG